MSAPGDDLRKYLVVPEHSSSGFSIPKDSGFEQDSAFGLNQDTALPLPPTLAGPNTFLANSSRNQTSDMEIDHHPQNPPNMSSHSQIFKLDDFVNANKDEFEAEKALKHAASPPSSSSLTPKPILLNNKNHGDTTNPALAPTPLPVGAHSSKHIVALFQKVQALALPQPTFTYRECGQNMWAANMSLSGLEELQGVTVDGGVFHSKSEAKEAVSKRALEVIEGMEREGRVRKTRKAVNRSVGAAATEDGEVKKEQKNWIGLLLEYQNSTASPQPQYTDYSVGTLFTSLCAIEGHPTPFGSLSSLHASKKEARQAAAKAAVEYFQHRGLWPDTYTALGGIKKKKTAQPQNVTPQEVGNGSLGPGATGSLSTPQRCASLAHLLSLPTPEWRSTPHPSSPDFHSVACYFKGAGKHEGPIGEVRNMFGKKKAKEECARLTLEYLVAVREERVSAGMRIVDEEVGRMGGSGGGMGGLGDLGRGRGVSVETDGGEFVDCRE